MPIPSKAGVKTTKVRKEKAAVVVAQPSNSKTGFFDFLRFGESYTSLILGIIVVIIATVLLLSFVHNRNISSRVNTPVQVANQQNNQSSQNIALISPVASPNPTVTSTPKPTTVIAKKIALTVTPKVEQKKIIAVKIEPTKVTPTKIIAAIKITPAPKKIVSAQPITPTSGTGKVYTIASGDTLWSIAEKNYKSGYNWVDIARANNLNDPNIINVGNKLVLPKVEQKIATINTQAPTINNAPKVNSDSTQTVITTDKITGTSYVVSKGDNLWNVAVRAYGDGYQWVKIAQANNLANPSVIHSGNNLKIPRA